MPTSSSNFIRALSVGTIDDFILMRYKMWQHICAHVSVPPKKTGSHTGAMPPRAQMKDASHESNPTASELHCTLVSHEHTPPVPVPARINSIHDEGRDTHKVHMGQGRRWMPRNRIPVTSSFQPQNYSRSPGLASVSDHRPTLVDLAPSKWTNSQSIKKRNAAVQCVQSERRIAGFRARGYRCCMCRKRHGLPAKKEKKKATWARHWSAGECLP
jgi:hypothetical protein